MPCKETRKSSRRKKSSLMKSHRDRRTRFLQRSVGAGLCPARMQEPLAKFVGRDVPQGHLFRCAPRRPHRPARQKDAPLENPRRGGALPRPHSGRVYLYRGLASAAAALLQETVLLSAATRENSRERAVHGYSFARGIARKEVEKPWFLPALLDTFPAAGKSVPCPGARNDPMGNLSYTVRAG